MPFEATQLRLLSLSAGFPANVRMSISAMAAQKSKAGLVNRFLGHVVPGIVRPMHALWNEIIGFFFIVLAIYFAPSAWRSVRTFDGKAESVFRTAGAVGFTLLMAYFGISSFLKARKISRS
jgi:hypothetical protein